MKRPPEDELDARLSELFRSVEQPAPSAGFAARTMSAVRGAPLPAGRQRLCHRWFVPLAWAALIGAAAVMTYALVHQPFVAELFASLVRHTLYVGTRLVHFVGVGFALSETFGTVGRGVARAAATREGTTVVMVAAGVAGTSLLALQRLLFSNGEGSQWQEVS